MFSLLVTTPAATPFVTLNNGVQMPAVAAGTWQYTAATAQTSVTNALKVGFTHIDTAHDYCADGTTGDCTNAGSSNQVGIGKALAGVDRSKFFLTTKVPGCGLQGISRDNCGADSVAAALKNLDELGLDYVDLLLVHFPPGKALPDPGGCGADNCGVMQEQWHALSGLVAQNKTRALGVSNFCTGCLECLAKTAGAIVPAVNQFKYHIGMGTDPIGLLSYCKANGIAPQAYSPLGDNSTELISGPLVSTIGAAHNKSGAQVALRWIWQNGVAVTTKATKEQYLKEDIDLFGWELTSDEMAKTNAATSPAGTPSFMCTA